MQNDSFKVLFYLRKAKTNSRGVAPLTCRITLNKNVKMVIFHLKWFGQSANIELETPKRTNQKDYKPQFYLFKK